MLAVEERFPAVKTFSLPFLGSQTIPFHVELGVRGAPEQISPAMDMLRQGVVALGYKFDAKPATA
jgi:hypothetical protein